MSGTVRDGQVLIVGAGPVGLSLAIELGLRGIACTVVEKNGLSNAHPRANVVASRTMEHFRRWGLADRALEAGLPLDYPVEVVFTTRLCAQEIHRFSFPSVSRCRQPSEQDLAAIPELSLSPYFKTSVGQNQLEPVLLERAQALDGVQVVFGCELVDLADDGSRVQVRLRQAGAEHACSFDYVVGCDGGRSTVRSWMEAELVGAPDLGRFLGIFFRADGFDSVHPVGRASLYWTLNSEAPGVFIAIDGGRHFTFQRTLRPGEDAAGLNPSQVLQAAMGRPFSHEIVSVQPWRAHATVAQRYRRGRVFIAGDAAHLFVPTGGFGMNTGIGDAVDLGWKLAAVLAGWGGPALLDSYEAERRPVGVRNTGEAADNYRKMLPAFEAATRHESGGQLPDEIRGALAAGLAAGRKHFSASGIHLGVRYEGSPIVIPDGSPAPPDEAMHYLPVVRPGHRAPHAWIGPGHSTLDLFGPGLVLVDASGAEGHAEWALAARAAGVPLEVVALREPRLCDTYDRACVLVRPDGHIAWRQTRERPDPAAVLARATGHLPSPP